MSWTNLICWKGLVCWRLWKHARYCVTVWQTISCGGGDGGGCCCCCCNHACGTRDLRVISWTKSHLLNVEQTRYADVWRNTEGFVLLSDKRLHVVVAVLVVAVVVIVLVAPVSNTLCRELTPSLAGQGIPLSRNMQGSVQGIDQKKKTPKNKKQKTTTKNKQTKTTTKQQQQQQQQQNQTNTPKPNQNKTDQNQKTNKQNKTKTHTKTICCYYCCNWPCDTCKLGAMSWTNPICWADLVCLCR